MKNYLKKWSQKGPLSCYENENNPYRSCRCWTQARALHIKTEKMTNTHLTKSFLSHTVNLGVICLEVSRLSTKLKHCLKISLHPALYVRGSYRQVLIFEKKYIPIGHLTLVLYLWPWQVGQHLWETHCGATPANLSMDGHAARMVDLYVSFFSQEMMLFLAGCILLYTTLKVVHYFWHVTGVLEFTIINQQKLFWSIHLQNNSEHF